MSRFLKKLKPLELVFKKFLMALLSLFMTRSGAKGDSSKLPAEAKNILVIKHEKIGDVIITLPLVDAIKKRWPGCKITFIASPLNYMVVENDPRFDKVYVYEKGLAKALKLIFRLRRDKFDYSVDMITQDTVTAMLLSNLSAPTAIKIGMGKRKYAKFYDVNMPHPMDIQLQHIVDYHMKLLPEINIQNTDVNCHARPYIDKSASDTAKEILDQFNSSDELKIGMNLSAGKPGCEWDQDKFRILARQLLDTIDKPHLFIITAPKEYYKGENLKEQFDERVFLPPPSLNLMTVSAIIKELDLLITPDTSLVHIARAFEVPVVGLYRRFNNEYNFWRPYNQNSGLVLSDDWETISGIAVERVLDEIAKVMGEFSISNGVVHSQSDNRNNNC